MHALNPAMLALRNITAIPHVIHTHSVTLASLHDVTIVELMSQVLEQLVSGEVMQMTAAADQLTSMEHYMQKTYAKTASLMANSARSVAVVAGVSTQAADCAWQYGRHLGLAFQIVDDILDLTGGCSSRAGWESAVCVGHGGGGGRGPTHKSMLRHALAPYGETPPPKHTPHAHMPHTRTPHAHMPHTQSAAPSWASPRSMTCAAALPRRPCCWPPRRRPPSCRSYAASSSVMATWQLLWSFCRSVMWHGAIVALCHCLGH